MPPTASTQINIRKNRKFKIVLKNSTRAARKKVEISSPQKKPKKTKKKHKKLKKVKKNKKKTKQILKWPLSPSFALP